MKFSNCLYFFLGFTLMAACKTNSQKTEPLQNESMQLRSDRVEKTEDEWKSSLSEMEYYVIREKGTERSFTGEYWDHKEEGTYTCRACDLPLFSSTTKYKSGTGWPSYYQPLEDDRIKEDTDYDLGYPRTEVMCARCDGHLGHVFKDGPKPTGLRYCINSVSLSFVKD